MTPRKFEHSACLVSTLAESHPYTKEGRHLVGEEEEVDDNEDHPSTSPGPGPGPAEAGPGAQAGPEAGPGAQAGPRPGAQAEARTAPTIAPDRPAHSGRSSNDDQRPPGRDEVAVVAALDAVGLTVTAIAAVLLAVTDATRIGRWVALAALAIAALTGAVTTVLLVWLRARRRAYVTNLEKVALRLESPVGLSPDSPYLKHAESLRDQAIKFREEGLAARLDAAIYTARRGGGGEKASI